MLPVKVVSKTDVTDRIAVFDLKIENGPVPEWSAGAHIDFDLGELGVKSYSLIRTPSSPSNLLRVAVQREENGLGGSKFMHHLLEGDTLNASKPKNDFPLKDDDKPVALIAGGIGVTPLISMATELHSEGRSFVLIYSGRSKDSMLYCDELQNAFASRVSIYCDDVNPMNLQNVFEQLAQHSVYVCGPKGMIEAAQQMASQVGISTKDVSVELFTSSKSDDADTDFEVEIKSSGQVVQVRAEETIIEALEAAGVDVMYDCQRGDCGICQVDVLEGEPDHKDVVLSQSEKENGNVMQICVSRAKSKRLVLDI